MTPRDDEKTPREYDEAELKSIEGGAVPFVLNNGQAAERGASDTERNLAAQLRLSQGAERVAMKTAAETIDDRDQLRAELAAIKEAVNRWDSNGVARCLETLLELEKLCRIDAEDERRYQFKTSLGGCKKCGNDELRVQNGIAVCQGCGYGERVGPGIGWPDLPDIDAEEGEGNEKG